MRKPSFSPGETAICGKGLFKGATATPFSYLFWQGISQNPCFLQLIGGVAWRKGLKGGAFEFDLNHPGSGCMLFPKENKGIFDGFVPPRAHPLIH